MRLIKADSFLKIWRIKGLYRAAFPKCERKPFKIIREMQRRGKTDLWYFEEDGKFLGMASTINGSGLILLDYFAVRKDLRGKGYGKRMLKAFIESYEGMGVFGEIETTLVDCPDIEKRKRRKNFYLSVGLSPMGVEVNLFGVRMELIGINTPPLTFEEYRNFYKENYTDRVLMHIKEIEKNNE